MKKRHYIRYIICLIAALLFTSSTLAVETVKGSSANADSIYVAGCPDSYPIEYYNTSTQQFDGIMPLLLKHVSQETGLTFTYLRGSEKDQRLRMAKNGQVEIVSCVKTSETQLIDALQETGVSLFNVEIDGTDTSYMMGYSRIASPELIAQINEALTTLSSDELLNVSIKAAGTAPQKNSFLIYAISATIIAVGCIIWIFILRRRMKEKSASTIITTTTEKNTLLSLPDFKTYFDDSVSDQSRAVFVIAYISFDTESMAKVYGLSSVSHELTLSAERLLKFKANDDLLTMDESGLIIARMSGGSESTEVWIQEILRHLNDGVSAASRLYYRAGIYRLTANDHNCTETISNAHQSYFVAAQQGQNYFFCTDQLLKKIRDQRQMADESELAFERNEFKLYLQLTVRSKDFSIIGAEALTRWDHPTRGLLHPSVFLSTLAENGSIEEMDFYIFEQVCKCLEDWQKQGIDLYISCNFTRNTIDNPNFFNKIKEASSKYHYDRSKLVIEITEDAIEANRELALENITNCQKHGFKIALDDVGSGITSFADLRDYPLDMIKIDRSILLKATTTRGKALLGSMIHLAQELNITPLCEGVESLEQATLLKNLDCKILQGYHFYRPMPAEIIQTLLDPK